MYQDSQRGFAIAAVIGIVAVLALVGGGAYVATKYDTNVDTEVSTTTGSMKIDGDIIVTKEEDEATTTLDASTTVNADLNTDVSTDINAGADVNLNLGY